MSRVAEKIPGWVERLLIPTLESKIRTIVREEVDHLEKVMNARFEAVNSKIDSLEKRFPTSGARRDQGQAQSGRTGQRLTPQSR